MTQVVMMRTDPFRELGRLTEQVLGTTARPAFMPMDAWRSGDSVIVEFDLPGVETDSIDLDVERNVLTVRAERPIRETTEEIMASERPRGLFSRQLVLGDNLDLDRVAARYVDGVLRLQIPIAERAKPRKITITQSDAPDRDHHPGYGGGRTIDGGDDADGQSAITN